MLRFSRNQLLAFAVPAVRLPREGWSLVVWVRAAGNGREAASLFAKWGPAHFPLH